MYFRIRGPQRVGEPVEPDEVGSLHTDRMGRLAAGGPRRPSLTDLKAVHTYGRTDHTQSLPIGRDLAGTSAIERRA